MTKDQLQVYILNPIALHYWTPANSVKETLRHRSFLFSSTFDSKEIQLV